MTSLLLDPQIQQIITPPNATPLWKEDLERLDSGDVSLHRSNAGEDSIEAFQRLLIFLGYSTSSGGSYSIDGDFGAGTNRGLAQFEFEHGHSGPEINMGIMAYDCVFQNARKRIGTIPEVRLTPNTLNKMLEAAKKAIVLKQVACGNFEEALFHLNAIHMRKYLKMWDINEKYGELAKQACDELKRTFNRTIHPEWILAVIKKETSGIVRPRFEQHHVCKGLRDHPNLDFVELRYRATSFGLGQVMGFNYKTAGADSARALYNAPLKDQVLAMGKFILNNRNLRPVVAKINPTANDFHIFGRSYNGSQYASHGYHTKLASHFARIKEIRQ